MEFVWITELEGGIGRREMETMKVRETEACIETETEERWRKLRMGD